MPELKVKVWRRYGKTRVYVSTAEPEPRTIGWYDPVTGACRLDDPTLSAPFWSAATAESERLLEAGKIAAIVPPQDPAAPEPAAAPPRSEAQAQAQAQAEPAAPQPETPAVSSEPAAPRAESEDPAEAAAPERAAFEPAVPEPEPGPEPAWRDLASQRPGEGVREHARELRRAHPVGSVLARLVGVRTDARAFAEGSRGERKVGRALEKYAARDGWHVLHGVQVSENGTDIDHVLVGAFGVVTVNTKRTSAAVRVGDHAIWVGGHQVPYLVKSRAEARRAYKRLLATGHDVPVRPALVFVGQQDFHRGRRPGHHGDAQIDVAVLPGPGALRDWVNRLPRVLDATEEASLYTAARRGDTWLA